MSNLSDMLIFLRKRAGLSQDELAKCLECSRSTIGMYETGKRIPPLETLEAYADIFNIDMNTLTGNGSRISEMTTDERIKISVNDGDLLELRERLRNQPGMRMLFDAAEGATAQQLEAVAEMIKAWKQSSSD